MAQVMVAAAELEPEPRGADTLMHPAKVENMPRRLQASRKTSRIRAARWVWSRSGKTGVHPPFYPGGIRVSGTSGKTMTLNGRVEGRLGLAATK